ncbi:MAG: hypothetical protein EBQ92_09915 [Proteobacteria bacterium]|nr:hypothetical protein [Pseudomonadota bacterium]
MKTQTELSQHSQWFGVLVKALIMMALPVIELVGLRLYFHQVLGLKLGFPGFTDFELILPAPLGFFALLLALEKAKKLDLKFQPLALILNLISVSCFVAVTLSQGLSILWLALLLTTIVSAFCVCIRPKDVYQNPNVWALGPSLIMVFSLVLYMKYGESLWLSTVSYLEGLIKGVLALMGNDLVEVSAFRNRMRIHHPVITVYLGQGCGGFDGLLFFLAAFSIFAPLNWELFKPLTWFKNCVLGLFFFLILNAIRIVSLFSLGVIAGQWWGRDFALKVIMGVFHTHMGYLLYAFGIGLFFNTLIVASQRRKASQKTTSEIGVSPQPVKN